MTAPSGKFIDKLIRGRLHPSLKELGFVRKGRTWNRDVNALKHVVNVQSGMFNSPRGGDFTINLGVFVPSVYRVVRGREPSFFANEIDCVVRLRLGALMEGGVLSSGASSGRKQDHWWAFGPDTDMEHLGHEVCVILVTRGIPFLDQFASVEGVCTFLEEHIDRQMQEPLALIYLAVMKSELGDDARSRQLFQDVCERYESWRDWARAASTRLGMNLDPANA